MTTTDPTPPEVIGRYQAAADRRDADTAVTAFTADARVADDGHEYRGTDEIRGWITGAASQFTFTRTFLGAESVAPDTWIVTHRIEGDFPGGVVDLRYRFTLAGDRIAELVIAP
jgi:ketosteroid isomerase-like protein